MICYAHENLTATNMCSGCGQFICADCSHKLDNKHICLPCAEHKLVQINTEHAHLITFHHKSPFILSLLSLPFIPMGMNALYAGQYKTALLGLFLNMTLFMTLLENYLFYNPTALMDYGIAITVGQLLLFYHAHRKITKYQTQPPKYHLHNYVLGIVYGLMFFLVSFDPGFGDLILSILFLTGVLGTFFYPGFYLLMLVLFILTGIQSLKARQARQRRKQNRPKGKKKSKKDIIRDLALKHTLETLLLTHAEQTALTPPVPAIPSELPENLQKLQDMLTQLKTKSPLLIGTDIYQPVKNITDTTQKINDFVGQYPNKLRQLDSFIDYYLPTTLDILRSYTLLQNQGPGGENIQASKEKINNLLSTLEQAYLKQLDSLFDEKAMNLDADIKVMTSLMTQQGLVD